MFAFLRKVVAPELIEVFARDEKAVQKPGRAAHERRLKLKRRAKARKEEARRLKMRSGKLYPPQKGSRRAEFSSARPGQWSTKPGYAVKEDKDVQM